MNKEEEEEYTKINVYTVQYVVSYVHRKSVVLRRSRLYREENRKMQYDDESSQHTHTHTHTHTYTNTHTQTHTVQ